MKCKEDGDRHFLEEGRVAEITMDLVSQARAKMAENKVNGPEDSVVSGMIKHLPLVPLVRSTECLLFSSETG